MMTTEQRLDRLERAIVKVAEQACRIGVMRGGDADPGIVAIREIAAEIKQLEDAAAAAARREALQAELAELGAA
jgi:hypothetical protein